jgi:hypothetical protein
MAAQISENLLIGSSNVYRLFNTKDHGQIRNYKMIKCTQSESFDAHMSNMASGCKFVIVSVIENFLVDSVTNDQEPDAEIVHCVRSFLKMVADTVTRLPGTKFAIVMPLQRPAVSWFQEKLAEVTSSLEKGIKDIQKKLGFEKIQSVKCSAISTQDFDPDNTHLTPASAKIFLDHILSKSEEFFVGGSGGEDSDVEVERDGAEAGSLEVRLSKLEKAHMQQVKMNFATNLMLARVREEIDAISNKAKEDRVVMNGLKSKTPMPVETRPRIEWLKGISMEIFKELVPNFPGKIFYLNQGQQMDVFLPMVEAKLDSVTNAMAIRRAFAVKRKNKQLPPDLESLFVTNCVNLATRVRIDVLRAIAKKVTNDKDIAYVSGFISRPMMHIKSAGSPTLGKPLKSFSFIDSVSRFHNLLVKEDLVTAYERAGRAFKGQLEQNFVVMNDADQIKILGYDPSGPWSKGGGGGGGGRRGGRGGGHGGHTGHPGHSGHASAGHKSGGSSTTGKRGSGGGAKGVKRSGEFLENAASKK